MKQMAREVLSLDAEDFGSSREKRAGKSVGRVIGEALAEAGMNGDIKAIGLLMELAGEDFRSRESERKFGLASGEVVLVEERPEDS